MQNMTFSLCSDRSSSQVQKKLERSNARHQHEGQRQNAVRQPRSQQQRVRDNSEVAADVPSKGPIALLQEFVQCSRDFPLPPSFSALQWHFDTRMATKAAVEHRAVVAFHLEGVPHHAAGSWQKSKKLAQRDAADRALGLFVGRWGEEVLKIEQNEKLVPPLVVPQDADEVRLLAAHCISDESCGRAKPVWAIEWEKDTCLAVVEVQILGVPHKLAGARCESESAARIDTARRALWYLQCPGFETTYEAEKIGPNMASTKIATPARWIDGASDEDAYQKTAVMCLQNRLQQEFSRQLRPGQSVCEWSYEADPEDEDWPPLFRATLRIPVVGKTFIGGWCRGQRGAQIETIEQVTAFLDSGDKLSSNA